MLINTATLNAIRVGFNASFKRGLGQATSDMSRIATRVPSTTSENKYGWLGKMPNMRKWIGPRVVQGLAEHDYAIKNDDFELTVGVGRNDIEDDNLGVYDPIFVEMGESTGSHPDILSFAALKGGFETECYDGQYFFDEDHPVLDEDGVPRSVSNFGGGAGTPWFLLSTGRALKPIIFQDRKKPQFVAKDKVDDENVFNNKEFVYGTDARYNVGYGFWQMAYASQQALDGANFGAAFAAVEGQKGDFGRPLGIKPDLLVCAPSQREAALELLNAERNAAGATNVWKGTVELLVTPWLA